MNSTYAWRSLWRRVGREDRAAARVLRPEDQEPRVELLAHARLARRHLAELLLRRLGRPQAVERHLLLVDVGEPDERLGAASRDLADQLLDQRPGETASPRTSTCQPG